MNKVVSFIKKEAVFVISAVVACISTFFVKPSVQYLEYINFSVLGLLFSLMVVVAGFSRLRVFDKAAEVLVEKTNSLRMLVVVLWCLCFFSAMLITNDVALITFVPLAITVLIMVNAQEYIIKTVVLQTVAANMGSMFTPMGNPQNLFLYDTFEVSLDSFFAITLPYVGASFVLLLLTSILLVKNKKIDITLEKNAIGNKRTVAMYSLLAFVSLLAVVKVVDYRIAVGVVVAVLLAFDRRVLCEIDWFLLLTFVMFFIFVGNIGNISGVNAALSQIIKGREVLSAVALSQVISNVPCSTMLAGFTDDYTALIIGTNLGGLGTLIASLASLISFKLYAAAADIKTSKLQYLGWFTVINIIFLLILFAIYGIVN